MKRAGDVVLRHRVGQCPACRDYLWAEVTVITYIGPPRIGDDGRASADARAENTAMRLSHECDKREDQP